MLASNERIIETILETIEPMQKRTDLPPDVLFDLTAVSSVLRHVQHVDTSNGDDMRDYGKQVADLIQAMKTSETSATAANTNLTSVFDGIIETSSKFAASPLTGNALKKSYVELLRLLEVKFGEIATISPNVATALFAGFTPQLLKQHNSVSLFAQQASAPQAEVSPGEPLTEANLTAYMREKLSDPTAEVKDVKTLPGGFGKETSLFTLTSQTLNGDLVMRRDSPIEPFGDLNCHHASKEYPVLKAVHERGFPGPVPIFFEEHPQIIKGPSFTIMRRALGGVLGDATGGQGKVPAELQKTLAEVTARLHSVAPLTELSNISALEPSLWTKSATECTRNYILAYYQHYQKTDHLPAPVIHGLFNWLLANVPVTDEPSTLIHGDIGFHNLMLDDGKLSALLDWEFTHVGDPAEDLGYIRSMMFHQLDWPQFLADYGNTGRPIPDEKRIKFFEIWSHIRNAACLVLLSELFETGKFRNIKYSFLIYRYLPHFIGQAEALIATYDK